MTKNFLKEVRTGSAESGVEAVCSLQFGGRAVSLQTGSCGLDELLVRADAR